MSVDPKGRRTGRRHERLVDLNETEHEDVVVINTDSEGGDSGRLYFDVDSNDDAYVLEFMLRQAVLAVNSVPEIQCTTPRVLSYTSPTPNYIAVLNYFMCSRSGRERLLPETAKIKKHLLFDLVNKSMAQFRRSVLQLSVAMLGSLTGCTTSPSIRQETSSTDSPQKLPELTFEAEVLEQTSVDSPAQVEASVLNEGSNQVDIGYGPTLLFTDNSASEGLDWSNHIVIDPETSVGPWKDPIQTDDHCWRYPANATRPVESSLEWRTLGAGESISETYEVYTDSDANTCLPGGVHRFQDQKYVTTESRPVVVTLILEIDDEGELVASTEEPDIGVTSSG